MSILCPTPTLKLVHAYWKHVGTSALAGWCTGCFVECCTRGDVTSHHPLPTLPAFCLLSETPSYFTAVGRTGGHRKAPFRLNACVFSALRRRAGLCPGVVCCEGVVCVCCYQLVARSMAACRLQRFNVLRCVVLCGWQQSTPQQAAGRRPRPLPRRAGRVLFF